MSRVALLCASVLAVACESAPARVHQPSAAAVEISASSLTPPSRAESLIASRALPAAAASPPPQPTTTEAPSGSEAVPVLEQVATSADGSRVLSLRKTSDAPLRRDLVIADADGSKEEVLVKSDPTQNVPGSEVPQDLFFNVSFDPRGGRVFFSIARGRGEDIFAVELATHKITWVTSGFGFDHFVIPGGKHMGDLLVVQHRYLKDAPGTYDACVVVDGRSGKQLREVTDLVEGCGDSPAMKRALGY